MHAKKVLSLAIVGLLTTTSTAAECGMDYSYLHSQTSSRIYTSHDGLPSIYYAAKVAVNTDGTPRSYSPDDLRGERFALNNIVNAMNGMYTKLEGKKITDCPKDGCFSGWVRHFQTAIDSEFDPNKAWVTTPSVIPWNKENARHRDMPCTQVIDGNTYYVSQTAYSWYHDDDACVQDQYLDALKFNANVLPLNSAWFAQGVVTDGFDLVVFRNGDRVAFGINGDRGPEEKIGEVSISAAAFLSGKSQSRFANYQQIQDLALPSAQYLIFPNVDLKRLFAPRRFTQADVDQVGARVFAEWGGIERLDACSGLAQVGKTAPQASPMAPTAAVTSTAAVATAAATPVVPGTPAVSQQQPVSAASTQTEQPVAAPDSEPPAPPGDYSDQTKPIHIQLLASETSGKSCFAKIAVRNRTALNLSYASISFNLPSLNAQGHRFRFEVWVDRLNPGDTKQGAQATQLATCEQLDLAHPYVECRTAGGSSCEADVSYAGRN